MQKLLVAYHSVRRITKSSDNLARWRGCSLPILPIADILADSVSRPCSHRWSSLRRSRPTPLSNMRILPRSEISGFLRCVLTVPLVSFVLVALGSWPRSESPAVKTAGEGIFFKTKLIRSSRWGIYVKSELFRPHVPHSQSHPRLSRGATRSPKGRMPSCSSGVTFCTSGLIG